MSAHIALVASVAPTAPADALQAAAPAEAQASFATALDQQITALLGAPTSEPRPEPAAAPAADADAAAGVAGEAPLALPWPLQSLPPAPPGDATAAAGDAHRAADATQAGAVRGMRTLAALTDTTGATPHAALEEAAARFPLLHGAADREGALPPPAAENAAITPPPLQSASAPPAATPPSVTLDVPVHAPEWRDAFGDRVVLLARDSVQSAELHVTPPELGPVSVRIDVNGSEASIVFGAQHADTRNAIADALPRLAELLAAQGLALGGAQVGAELARDRQPGEAEPGRADGDDDIAPRIAAPGPAAIRRGLVDLFA